MEYSQVTSSTYPPMTLGGSINIGGGVTLQLSMIRKINKKIWGLTVPLYSCKCIELTGTMFNCLTKLVYIYTSIHPY